MLAPITLIISYTTVDLELIWLTSTRPLLDTLTVQLEYFDHYVGQKRVISGSDPDYFMGQRVIRVSEVEAIPTLIYTYKKQCHPHKVDLAQFLYIVDD